MISELTTVASEYGDQANLSKEELSAWNSVVHYISPSEQENIIKIFKEQPEVIPVIIKNTIRKIECLKNNDLSGLEEILKEEEVLLG